MKSKSTRNPNACSRRGFLAAGGAVVVGNALLASSAMTKNSRAVAATKPTVKIPLGFDNFSLRAHNWKADRLIDFATQQKLDSLLLSDLDVYETHETKYLQKLRAKAADAGITLHAGTGSICSTAKRFKDKWGSPEQLLKLGIRIAQDIGSPVFRCYLGGQNDRQTPGGIQKHINTTIRTLKQVKSAAIDANVKIAVENHAGDMQAWELVELIEAAGSDFVGATIDSGNATWTLESPQSNLETLGRYAVSSGMRDSTVWQYEKGAKVAWNAIGEGQVDWKKYAATFAELCPGIPFQLEIISGFDKPFAFKEKSFWDAYPKARARDFEQFLELARTGKKIAKGQANDPEFQMNELLKSIRYCKAELNMGLKS